MSTEKKIECTVCGKESAQIRPASDGSGELLCPTCFKKEEDWQLEDLSVDEYWDYYDNN